METASEGTLQRASLPRRLVRRARYERARVRTELQLLASPRRTALRIPPDQQAVPPSAFAAYGENSWIVPPVRVLNPGRIAVGSGVVLMEHASLWVLAAEPADEPLLVIGDGVRLTRFCTVICEVGITIGDQVASSDGATIIDTWRPLPGSYPPINPHVPKPAPVVIEAGAYLGMNCIVGPGVRVGEGAFVGEGAVVLDDVPARSVVYGNPAVVTRRYDSASQTWEGPQWP